MSSARPKLVFFGTPEFANPALQGLVDTKTFDITAVVTQADKPSGRGQKLQAPPIKVLAEKLGIPVYQPKSIKNIETVGDSATPRLQGAKSSASLAEFLSDIAPIDVFVCVAYGKIIPTSLLSFARCGMVNIHPSLLPRWRGAAPLQWALFSGDKETGVSIMKIEEGLDTGPVFLTEHMQIAANETIGSLHDKAAQIGAELLVKALPAILDGSLQAAAQNENGVTYAEKWEKEDCLIKWSEDAAITLRRIRTCDPFPGARSELDGGLVKIFKAREVENQNFPPSPPGDVVEVGKGELIVACGDSQYIAIDELQFSGKKRLPVEDALRGRQISVGQSFS